MPHQYTYVFYFYSILLLQLNETSSYSSHNFQNYPFLFLNIPIKRNSKFHVYYALKIEAGIHFGHLEWKGGHVNVGLSQNKTIPLDICYKFGFFYQQKQLWTVKVDILLIRIDVDLYVFTSVGCSLEHGNSANRVLSRRAYPHYHWCSFQAKFNSAGNIFIWFKCTSLGCCRSEFSTSNASHINHSFFWIN